ncbi:MAG TPA: molybdenum cofactor guanylyltransferase [Thermomicrobiales bacterium]|nr:molybdenum cofactor guanylyltransferase [Thermomicrobiales bacterium]
MTSDGNSCVGAAVLTGGQSRRMGFDKAMLRLDGHTLLRRTLDVLLGLTDHVTIIGDRARYHGLGVPVVADLFPDAGPLGGIATALDQAACSRVLIVACDMPFLSAAVLRDMLSVPGEYDAVVPVTARGVGEDDGALTFHPLHALYSRAFLPVALAAIVAGDLKVSNLLMSPRVRALPESWMRARDAALATLVNVNSPDELEDALKIHGRH